MMISIKVLFFIFSVNAFSLTADSSLNPDGVVSPVVKNSLMNPDIDYASFSGRVTDVGDDKKVFKIKVENNNIKFFKAGDLVEFKVGNQNKDHYCEGNVRNVEDFYFTIFVAEISPCYERFKYFRRGTILNFYSETLARRVFESSEYRKMLLTRKDAFLNQLNGINHFLFAFDEEKLKLAASFDAEISEIERRKREALGDFVKKKQEKLILQNELRKRLNDLDENLKYYYVERQELIFDRWKHDHHRGLPFDYRPQEIIKQ